MLIKARHNFSDILTFCTSKTISTLAIIFVDESRQLQPFYTRAKWFSSTSTEFSPPFDSFCPWFQEADSLFLSCVICILHNVMFVLRFAISFLCSRPISPKHSIIAIKDMACWTKIVRNQHYFQRRTTKRKSKLLYFNKCKKDARKEHSPFHWIIPVTSRSNPQNISPFTFKLLIKRLLPTN